MSDDERARILDIGTHRARFDPPDIIRVWWNGPSGVSEIDTLYTWSAERLPDGTPYFVVADMTGLVEVGPAARKAAAGDPRAHRVAGIAIIGANFHMRVLMGMISKALRLFYGQRRFQMEFFEREDEALAWVAAERARRAATSG
ncbi:STAS/SEC14 domain-containing protein [Polyangium sp. y55x31]|uniref:STAS/SEC14 domain-containing protein n=1 Tax=Polyangium sp. y55x31 TaxID=3042688 RepID=UPI002482BE64|nr:STAS/SEC14 domain-containing protein [Polyangium sp. y55x31]MDI1483810.1 STAS/SEC14 domain-containing protein [Polyangium sp. y55x31]